MKNSKNVYIEAYGCSANVSDSELIAGMLSNDGYNIVDDVDKSDLNIIVTCTVKDATASRMRHRIKSLTGVEKPLIVAGCMAKAEQEAVEKLSPSASLLGPNSLDQSLPMASLALQGGRSVSLADSNKVKLLLPRLRKNSLVGIVEIATGCLSSCSFCQTKVAKDHLISYPVNDIVRDVTASLNDGCKEIWLTSTDNGCYGLDIGTSLSYMVDQVCGISRDFKVRVGMMNPMYLVKNIHGLIESYQNNKVFKFLHIPVQSGSSKILRDMKRGHNLKQFIDIVQNFRAQIPDMTFSTDIIVGYPSETDEDFDKTVNLLNKIQPDVVNISKYSSRPKTLAHELKQLDAGVVKERSSAIHRLTRKISLERNQRWLGWTGKIVVDEQVKNAVVGRNFAYKPIVLKEQFDVGDEVSVEIVDVTSHTLVGKISH